MKATSLFLTLAFAVAFAGTAYALDTVQGTVVSVDSNQKRVQIRTQSGDTRWVNYADLTTLPVDIDDASGLQGQDVRITLDNDEAQSIEQAMANHASASAGIASDGSPALSPTTDNTIDSTTSNATALGLSPSQSNFPSTGANAPSTGAGAPSTGANAPSTGPGGISSSSSVGAGSGSASAGGTAGSGS